MISVLPSPLVAWMIINNNIAQKTASSASSAHTLGEHMLNCCVQICKVRHYRYNSHTSVTLQAH